MSSSVVVENFSPSLIHASELAAKRKGRTADGQLEHWARVGRSILLSSSLTMKRVELALTGELARERLSELESTIFDAEVEAKLEE